MSTLLPEQNRGQPTELNRGQSLFFNDRQWKFFKHISAQLVQHVAKQQVYYYVLSQDTLSSRHKLYGQRKKKIWNRPKTLYGRVLRHPVQTQRGKFGTVSVHSIGIFFDKNYLDQRGIDINKMTGNQVEWDHKPFQVKKMQMFDRVKGLTEYKMTVLVTAVYTQD